MNQWSSYEKLVLDKIEHYGKKIDKQSELLTKVRIDVAKLKTSARIWGLLAGAVGAAALMYIQGLF